MSLLTHPQLPPNIRRPEFQHHVVQFQEQVTPGEELGERPSGGAEGRSKRGGHVVLESGEPAGELRPAQSDGHGDVQHFPGARQKQPQRQCECRQQPAVGEHLRPNTQRADVRSALRDARQRRDVRARAQPGQHHHNQRHQRPISRFASFPKSNFYQIYVNF